jgi:hypothetical protein
MSAQLVHGEPPAAISIPHRAKDVNGSCLKAGMRGAGGVAVSLEYFEFALATLLTDEPLLAGTTGRCAAAGRGGSSYSQCLALSENFTGLAQIARLGPTF